VVLKVQALAMRNVARCLAADEQVVFVNEFSHRVLNVDNPDSLKDLMGHRVAVQGPVDETAGTIHVDKAKRKAHR